MQNNTHLDCERVLEDAKGRWYGILRHFGIEVGDGKHTACPVCGGKDRFRFDDKDGRGSWICNQCGAGDGLALLMKITNTDFIEACTEVSKIVGTVDQRLKPESPPSPEKLREMFVNSQPIKPGDPVTAYLKARGLSDFPKMLRYGKTWEYETKQDQDAMLAVFSLADGEAVTIHRTFIKDGKKLDIESSKKVMPPLKKMTGGAVRLYPGPGEMLGVTEGIETAIAVHQMYDIPVWAALSATLMESFEPPAWANVIEVFSDNDRNYTGQRAAYILANRLAIQGKVVNVSVSKHGDFLEDLLKRGEQ